MLGCLRTHSSPESAINMRTPLFSLQYDTSSMTSIRLYEVPDAYLKVKLEGWIAVTVNC